MGLGQPSSRILRLSLVVTLALLALSLLYSISISSTPSPQADPHGNPVISMPASTANIVVDVKHATCFNAAGGKPANCSYNSQGPVYIF